MQLGLSFLQAIRLFVSYQAKTHFAVQCFLWWYCIPAGGSFHTDSLLMKLLLTSGQC